MRVLPPELEPRLRHDYFTDLEYREQCDLENAAERHERLNLLFNPERVAN